MVQGVGFRPFFYRAALQENIQGYIKNTSFGVEIVGNNKKKVLEILKNIPPLAEITSLQSEQIGEGHIYKDFQILASENSCSSSNGGLHIPPDVSICNDCREDLCNPNNRRYKYFFTSCTHCGPRFSLAKDLPFDRENTTLADFPLCSQCRKEYTDPGNRRFHAQTITCPQCGPQLSFYNEGKKEGSEPLKRTIDLLKKGEVVSIKGVGGFFLASRIGRDAVSTVRLLLHRPKKPFAIMVKDIHMAKKFCEIRQEEERELLSLHKPIVLCKKKQNKKNTLDDISSNDRIGILLPSTALHILLFEEIDEPLLITSANLPGVPIPTRRKQQNWKYILDFNRDIVNFSDDSVVKVLEKQPLCIRRSRGYVPQTLTINNTYRAIHDKKGAGDILAVGAEMKNTFCLKKGDRIFLSQHLGNTEKIENFENFKHTLQKYLKYTLAKPEVILCDANPDFETSQFAQKYAEQNEIICIPIQHHKAHIFSAAFEHGLDHFVGIAADGNGWGEDEKVWGGEVFLVSRTKDAMSQNPEHNQKQVQRIGHLEYQKLVGGDIANREPLRFLVGILEKFMTREEIQKRICENVHYRMQDVSVFYQQAQQNFNCIETSSCGRVLDASAILLGIGEKNYYEGHLAELLETCAAKSVQSNICFFEPVIKESGGQYILYTTPLFQFLVENMRSIPREELARFVVVYLAKGFLEIAQKNKYSQKLPLIFSGGCAYSSVMTNFFLSKGVNVNKDIPAGDGGISAGQIAYYLATNHHNTL